MKYIGITERGDGGLDLSWESKLDSVECAVIVTKSINDNLINALLRNKHKLILHCTCTGFGGTVIEPNVHDFRWTYNQICKLINSGFPKEQIVLRIDPIIPTPKALNRIETILNLFSRTGITRVRYSFLDMYNHVKNRFINAGFQLPFSSFSAPKSMIDKAYPIFKQFEDIYTFESCAELDKHRLGCISQKDIDILNLDIELEYGTSQRPTCLCPKNKLELLNNAKQCAHRCIYCYWRKDYD